MPIELAPFLANLCLYSFENKSVTNLIGVYQVRARTYHGTSRFIDDESYIND